ncbi:N-acetylmuramoyl-L-alanine amidase [Streptomyces solisilvae]|uniref:N-acetylmuramoyl-L-alanine amidase n=2 Tax=Streptomyces TaxID=1883 RepID=UPI00368640A4
MSLKFVSRSAWGAKPSKYALTYISSTKGVKIHYEGSVVGDLTSHSKCDDHMRAIQASHLANAKENYSDIAYNLVVCPHGYVYEGRGAHRKTGANGNQTLNIAHYAVCAMLFKETPTDEMLSGLRDAIEYLQSKGDAGTEIRGHRDGYATECPGEKLYAWVKKGAPRPAGSTSGGGTTNTSTNPPSTTPSSGARGSLGTWPGESVVAVGKSNSHVLKLQKRLRNALGASKAKQLNPNGATGYYGSETKAMVTYALRNHPETWSKGATKHDGRVG